MKLTSRSLCLPIAVITLAFSFVISARAETAREEMVHAYHLLKWADADYHGHKAAAMEELKAAGKELNLDMEGAGWEHESQRKSDEQLKEARRLLRDSRDKLEEGDRNRVAKHVEKAVKELDSALEIK
jgi:hypothetical protein